MKLRRILAASAAAVVAASAMSVVSFAAADFWAPGTSGNSGLIACLVSDNGTPTVLEDTSLAYTVTDIDIIVTCKNFDQAVEDIEDGIWIGGDVCLCSPSWGWGQKHFNFAADEDCTVKIDKDAECFVISYDNVTPIFVDGDKYCQIHLHDYSGGTVDIYGWEVKDVVLHNAEGVDVRTLDGAAATTPDDVVVDEPVVDGPIEDETPDVIAPAPDDVIADEPIADEPIVDEPAADDTVVDEPAADDTVVDTEAPVETGKDAVDTGVEGIAAVAGVVALAGVAVVASRKRK